MLSLFAANILTVMTYNNQGMLSISYKTIHVFLDLFLYIDLDLFKVSPSRTLRPDLGINSGDISS